MTDSRVPDWPPPPPGALVWAPPALRPRAVPATVQAAVVVTYLCCALAAVMTVFFLLVAAFVGSVVAEYFEPVVRIEFVLAVVGSAAVSLVACTVACWFAWLTSRRKLWARVALAACSAVALVMSVVAVGPHTLVVLPGSVAVLVLLFLPQSNAWFRR